MRTYSAGIQRHAIGVTAGLAFGLWLDKRLQERAAGRDYFYYHYICEHPEDFPVIGNCFLYNYKYYTLPHDTPRA